VLKESKYSKYVTGYRKSANNKAGKGVGEVVLVGYDLVSPWRLGTEQEVEKGQADVWLLGPELGWASGSWAEWIGHMSEQGRGPKRGTQSGVDCSTASCRGAITVTTPL
jgi:hypothetical protein